MRPIKIKLTSKSKLSIHWDNGFFSEIQTQLLRKECPCATCLAEKERQGAKYIPIYSESEVTINKINIVGNYAISIIWKDGHNTGIYEFPYLLRLTASDEKILET